MRGSGTLTAPLAVTKPRRSSVSHTAQQATNDITYHIYCLYILSQEESLLINAIKSPPFFANGHQFSNCKTSKFSASLTVTYERINCCRGTVWCSKSLANFM